MTRLALPTVNDVAALEPGAVAPTLLQLAALQSALAARLLEVPRPAAEAGPERLLKVREAAERCGMGEEWLYKHAASLPFTRRVGRAVRFSEAGLVKWMATRGR